MTPIHPITEQNCKPFYGKPVCVVLKDGTELFGTLSRLDGSRLILNDETRITKSAKGRSRNRKSRTSIKLKTANQAKTAAFPVSPISSAIVLDLELTALMFALA